MTRRSHEESHGNMLQQHDNSQGEVTLTAELRPDTVTVPGQQWALVSFVTPDGRQRGDKLGMKLRGCFSTPEEAHAHVELLRQTDKYMHVFMVQMYHWCVIPPDPDAIPDQKYQEEFLDTLFAGYRENQEKAKQDFGWRKEAVRTGGLDAQEPKEYDEFLASVRGVLKDRFGASEADAVAWFQAAGSGAAGAASSEASGSGGSSGSGDALRASLEGEDPFEAAKARQQQEE